MTDPHLARVSERIARLVLDFLKALDASGEVVFRMEELSFYVAERTKTAPDSAGRILRDLRLKGLVDYIVLSRRESLYQLLKVSS